MSASRRTPVHTQPDPQNEGALQTETEKALLALKGNRGFGRLGPSALTRGKLKNRGKQGDAYGEMGAALNIAVIVLQPS